MRAHFHTRRQLKKLKTIQQSRVLAPCDITPHQELLPSMKLGKGQDRRKKEHRSFTKSPRHPCRSHAVSGTAGEGSTISNRKYHQPSEASSTIRSVKKFELLPFPAITAQYQEQQVSGGTISHRMYHQPPKASRNSSSALAAKEGSDSLKFRLQTRLTPSATT